MGVAVEVTQRQSAQLRLDVATHSRHDSLGQPGHREALEVAEGGAEQVHERGEREDSAQIIDVDTDPWGDVHSGDHRRDLAVTVFPK